jgi:hypothetical protein
MRKILFSIVLILSLSLALPPTFGQRRASSRTSAKTSATLLAARGVDVITAAQ